MKIDSDGCRRLARRAVVLVTTWMLLTALVITVDGSRDCIEPADVAVVLGSKVEIDGRPAPNLAARLDRAVELYREGVFPRILVSGGTGVEGFDEAKVMKEYLAAHGVPGSAVTTDSAGNDTFLTARHTRDFVLTHRLSRVMIISEFFHISRTRLALKRFGIGEVSWSPARYHTPRNLWSLVRESIGIYVYLLRSYPPAETPAS